MWAGGRWGAVWRCSLLRRDHVILEVAGAVGLRPEADLAVDRRAEYGVVLREEVFMRQTSAARLRLGAERVFERESAIEPGFEIGAVHGHLQLMPRGAIQRERLGAVAEFDG